MVLTALLTALIVGCASAPTASIPEDIGRDADELLIVDCLLPGQVRRLGTRLTYLSPRRPVKTAASVCEIRGGEYAAYDRANFATALKIWLPQAEEGDADAQTYVGEIYEKGLGATADYALAAVWYRRAAEQGNARANINLGYLYEAGLGVQQNLTEAMNLYRQASGLTDGDLEYVSSIEYANREAAEVESERLQQQVGTLQQALEDTEARYAERQSRFEQSRTEIVALREQVEAERRRVISEENSVENAVGRGAQTGSTASTAETDPTDAVDIAENVQLKAELESASTAIAEREAELRQLTDRLAEAQRPDEASRERRAALETQLATTGDALEQARQEQTRLSARLRDTELDAAQRERGDALIIAGQEQALADRERSIERQTTRIGSLEQELARSESLLAGAPDRAERDRLQRQVAEQQGTLDEARAEQRRLTERLVDQQLVARRERQEADSRLASLEETLAVREGQLARQRDDLQQLEQEVAGNRVRLSARDADKVASVVTRGPSIDIIDPPMLVTRGNPTLSAADRATLELIGKVDPPDSLLAFKINGATQPLSTAGVFRYFVARDERALELLAIDEEGVSTRLSLDLGDRGSGASSSTDVATADTDTGVADDADVDADGDVVDQAAVTTRAKEDATVNKALQSIDFGNYHALIVGNDDYTTMSDLNTAAADARTVERVLRERYGFKTELLIDATRYDMLSALNRLRENLTPEDNLLVYYAGHGELDDVSRRGYWLPVDASIDDTRNWIPNSAITDQINAMAAKHVMVVADSCYSGTLTRSSVARQPPDMSPELKARWFTAMAASKVRTVLSSGGVRPVFDGAPGAEHSIFAQAFIDELDANGGALEAYSLFVNIQQKVSAIARSLQVEQNPQYSPIRHSGHEAGEFVFVARPRAS